MQQRRGWGRCCKEGRRARHVTGSGRGGGVLRAGGVLIVTIAWGWRSDCHHPHKAQIAIRKRHCLELPVSQDVWIDEQICLFWQNFVHKKAFSDGYIQSDCLTTGPDFQQENHSLGTRGAHTSALVELNLVTWKSWKWLSAKSGYSSLCCQLIHVVNTSAEMVAVSWRMLWDRWLSEACSCGPLLSVGPKGNIWWE